jgi:hypothetical protein
MRQTKSKPILDAFHVWLTETKPTVPPKSGLFKALQYSLNQWPHLIHFANDGAVAIDNNAAERHIKPFAVGRKNWLFMGSPEGARAAATLYSLIETAKLNRCNPEGYLKFVLSHKIEATDEAFLEKLMPWNAVAQDGYPPPKSEEHDVYDDVDLDKNDTGEDVVDTGSKAVVG